MTEELAGLHEGEVSQRATSSSSGCFLPPLLFSKPQPGFLSLTQVIDNLIPCSSVPQNVSYVHSFLFSYPSPLLFYFIYLFFYLRPSLPVVFLTHHFLCLMEFPGSISFPLTSSGYVSTGSFLLTNLPRSLSA